MLIPNLLKTLLKPLFLLNGFKALQVLKTGSRYFILYFFVVSVPTSFLLPAGASALEPEEILVVANTNVIEGVALARYYMRQRGIHRKNLLKVSVTDRETCSRNDYINKIALPIREYICSGKPVSDIRCILVMYGLPLRVSAPLSEFKEKLKELKKSKDAIKKKIKHIESQEIKGASKLKKELKSIKKEIAILMGSEMIASLDSELSLVLVQDYPLKGWIANPFYIGFHKEKKKIGKDKVLMVSRLDATSIKIVKRIIDDSLKAEKDGLKGIAYFDARWKEQEDKDPLHGYKYHDMSIHKAAKLVKKSSLMPVVLNESSDLFAPDKCPEAALYCGWYSLGKYIDSFKWQPGSIGYHIASSECVTLKKENSRIWCKMMLEKGISATVGPVGEPYVQAFPVPEIFFGYLTDAYLSLAECYIISVPFLSWKMVLIGDPLYRPFKTATQVEAE